LFGEIFDGRNDQLPSVHYPLVGLKLSYLKEGSGHRSADFLGEDCLMSRFEVIQVLSRFKTL
jgi:hypothetical protein